MHFALQLAVLGIASFLQNMAFTWTSRARNSADPRYLWLASVCSNSVFYVIQVGFMATIWPALTKGDWWSLVLTGIVYVIGNSWGAVYMMKILLNKETGKRKVGAT
jgi:hypothetical protein